MLFKFSCGEPEWEASWFPVSLLKCAWPAARAQTSTARLAPRRWGDPGGKHCRAEQVIAEAAAAFWESQRPCQEGLGSGQMSSIHNQPGEDGTFRKAIKGPMRCRFWLPCCAHPFELGPRWSAGAQEHADRLVSFLPVPAQGQGDRAKGPSAPTSSSETRLSETPTRQPRPRCRLSRETDPEIGCFDFLGPARSRKRRFFLARFVEGAGGLDTGLGMFLILRGWVGDRGAQAGAPLPPPHLPAAPGGAQVAGWLACERMGGRRRRGSLTYRYGSSGG